MWKESLLVNDLFGLDHKNQRDNNQDNDGLKLTKLGSIILFLSIFFGLIVPLNYSE